MIEHEHAFPEERARRPLEQVVVPMQPVLHRRLERIARTNRMSVEELITTLVLSQLDESEPDTESEPAPDAAGATPPATRTLLKANLVASAAAIALGLALVVVSLVVGW